MPPINEELILEITHMVTEETLGKDTNSGWRGGHVQVISVCQKVIYPASSASFPKQIKYRWNRFILFTFPEHSIYTGCLYASSHNMRGQAFACALDLPAKFFHLLPGCRHLLRLHGAKVLIFLFQALQILLGLCDLPLKRVILLLRHLAVR